MPHVQSWEYAHVFFASSGPTAGTHVRLPNDNDARRVGPGDAGSLHQLLNKLGAEGWQLVSTQTVEFGQTHFWLMRPRSGT